MGGWGQGTGQPRSSTAGRQGMWVPLQQSCSSGDAKEMYWKAFLWLECRHSWTYWSNNIGAGFELIVAFQPPAWHMSQWMPIPACDGARSVTLVCIRWQGPSNTDQVSYQLSCESDLDYNIDINILITCVLLRILMTNLLCLCLLRIRN